MSEAFVICGAGERATINWTRHGESLVSTDGRWTISKSDTYSRYGAWVLHDKETPCNRLNPALGHLTTICRSQSRAKAVAQRQIIQGAKRGGD